jgi:hypothetical protein
VSEKEEWGVSTQQNASTPQKATTVMGSGEEEHTSLSPSRSYEAGIFPPVLKKRNSNFQFQVKSNQNIDSRGKETFDSSVLDTVMLPILAFGLSFFWRRKVLVNEDRISAGLFRNSLAPWIVPDVAGNPAISIPR